MKETQPRKGQKGKITKIFYKIKILIEWKKNQTFVREPATIYEVFVFILAIFHISAHNFDVDVISGGVE